MYAFPFFRYGNRILVFSLFSKRVQILKTEYKYGQYCTPLIQSDCRYFLVLNKWVDYKIFELKYGNVKVVGNTKHNQVNLVLAVFLSAYMYQYSIKLC